MQPPPDPVAASGERESSRGALSGGLIIGQHYRVIGHLGSGGMADVYEVEHVRLGRHFALKRLRSELAQDTSLVERFVREARAVAKLESVHVVAIVDSGTAEDGAPFFVMERLYGEELRTLLTREGALTVQRAVHIALDVCRALTVAHAAGVIHRDLKPENLFVTRSELGTDHCKVLDFGVAKLAGENPTMPGTLMGTARYMAPEQISHSTAIAPFTDIFSLGVILYECLSGTTPFAADTLERVLFKILNEPAQPLHELRPEIPQGLAELVARALAKSGSERPQSAAAFAEALSRFIEVRLGSSQSFDSGEDDTLLEVDPRVPTPPRSVRPSPAEAPPEPRRRWGLLLAGLTFTLGLVLGVVWGRRDRVAAPAELASAASAPSATPPPLASTSVQEAPAQPQAPGASAVVPIPAPPAETRAAARPASASPSAAPPAAPSVPPLFFPRDSGK